MKLLRATESEYEQAAWWMLRLEEGELRPAERQRYERWLKVPGHKEVMHRMTQFSGWLDQVSEHISMAGSIQSLEVSQRPRLH